MENLLLLERDFEAIQFAIEKLATRIGANFPSHIMDVGDFIQEGWLGVLSVKSASVKQQSYFAPRANYAARYRMIDAMRYFNAIPGGGRGVRRLETPLGNIEDASADVTSTEELDSIIDCEKFFRSLPERDREIFRLLTQGHLIAEIAERFNLTEGRISQIAIKIKADFLKNQQ